MDPFYHLQIITYMGNKRKLLTHILAILELVKTQLKRDKLDLGDGFAGSGVVSRLFKNHAASLYTNDLAGYSKTLNNCYLASPDIPTLADISIYIASANAFVKSKNNLATKFVQLHWSPKQEVVEEGERAYYTVENGRRIDSYRHYIETMVPPVYRDYLLAPLLVEASKHNNCSGNFAAFYKKDNIGHFGGKNDNDVKRIMQDIELPMPLFSSNTSDANVYISQKDTNDWVKELPILDLVYYDPPYNKHPYHIYYFLLDVINTWDTTVEIPDTFRGQPKDWKASPYNSLSKARQAFDDLIKNTRARYILVSYNNEGIINEADMMAILGKYGDVTPNYVEHSTYNRMKGTAAYKKGADKGIEKIKECLYLLRVTGI